MEKQQQSNTHDNMKDYSESIKAFVGKDYSWPDWNEKLLGTPPMIVMPKFQTKDDVAEFNKVLSDISKMASVESANELRDQLKALNGKEINIKDLAGNADSKIGPLGGPVTGEMHGVGSGLENDYAGHKPEISFNPRVWGTYPVDGSKNEYSIATPEQLLIHELGHYVEIQKIYDGLMLKNRASNVPVAADANDKKAYSQAINELHIVKDYENPAMASVDPNYKFRDADRYSDARILFANESGYPNVTEQERATLIHSMQVSGREIPNQLNIPITPDSPSSKVEKDKDVNYEATNAILNLKFYELAKAGVTPSNLESLRQLTSNIIDNNAKNNTLQVVEVQEKAFVQTSGREFT